VTIGITTDPSQLIRFARIVEKHMGALADDLEQMTEPELKAVARPGPPEGRDTIQVRSQ
jgi:hypothetical protein